MAEQPSLGAPTSAPPASCGHGGAAYRRHVGAKTALRKSLHQVQAVRRVMFCAATGCPVNDCNKPSPADEAAYLEGGSSRNSTAAGYAPEIDGDEGAAMAMEMEALPCKTFCAPWGCSCNEPSSAYKAACPEAGSCPNSTAAGCAPDIDEYGGAAMAMDKMRTLHDVIQLTNQHGGRQGELWRCAKRSRHRDQVLAQHGHDPMFEALCPS